jgi:hypothetical protein
VAHKFQQYVKGRFPRTGSTLIFLTVAIAIIAAIMLGLSTYWRNSPSLKAIPTRVSDEPPVLREKFSVNIRKPESGPKVHTGLVDSQGKPVTVACQTCHSTRKPNSENKTVDDLNEFHVGLKFSHGNLSCLSCHNDEDYDSLKLADQSRIEYAEVMTLCSQCHGTQRRDFDHGAHGGMNGYWDLSRGPRTRNNCVDCHDPHVPKFPHMQPTFKPRDRFLTPSDHSTTSQSNSGYGDAR